MDFILATLHEKQFWPASPVSQVMSLPDPTGLFGYSPSFLSNCTNLEVLLTLIWMDFLERELVELLDA